MIDHIGLYCRDATASLAFYRPCLAALGIHIVEEQPRFKAAIFKRLDAPIFWWLGEGGPEWRAQAGRSRLHIGFSAADKSAVDAFYAAGLAAGGVDNGPPGYRRPTLYSAFLIDPDGNNVEAIWRSEPTATSVFPTVGMAAEPQLFVADLDVACAFYVGKLGFEVTFVHGEPPFYAQVVRDNARLNLRRSSGSAFDQSFRAREPDALSATLTLDRAEPLFEAYRAAGVEFHQALRTEPWGARTFIVRDPDGNLLAFAAKDDFKG